MQPTYIAFENRLFPRPSFNFTAYSLFMVLIDCRSITA